MAVRWKAAPVAVSMISAAVIAALCMGVVGLTGKAEAQTPRPQEVNADSSDVLAEQKGVLVVVEDLSKDADKIGLTDSRIQTAVELKLRQSGIKVLTKQEHQEILSHPYLYINVNVFQEAFSIDVEHREVVQLTRGKKPTVFGASIWRKGATGMVRSDPEYVVSSVGRLVDNYCNDFLKANPKGAAR